MGALGGALRKRNEQMNLRQKFVVSPAGFAPSCKTCIHAIHGNKRSNFG
jgi:hypothetical protein